MSINLVRPSQYRLDLIALARAHRPLSLPRSLQDEELRLFTTPAERELYDSLATLFSIIVSLDYLERAYVRDSVSAKE
jgi:hypothetical protein